MEDDAVEEGESGLLLANVFGVLGRRVEEKRCCDSVRTW